MLGNLSSFFVLNWDEFSIIKKLYNNKDFFFFSAESDICTFASRTEHFRMKNVPTTSLFKSDTRPKALQELYDAAAIVAVKSLDSLRRGRDGSSMDLFMCTPVLGKRKRDKSLDIESRVVSKN